MKKPKIVIIGVGSASFGLSCLRDAFTTKELWGSELALVDIDLAALERMKKAAVRMNEELGAGYIITSSTNRCEMLKDADFVIISIAIDRDRMWKLDFLIPQKYGVKHVLGENGGPGAVFHTMRNMSIILDICRDIEKLCPDALVINFTNPESRICLAIKKYTKVKVIGLCHQINKGIKIISKIMNRKPEDLDVKAAGLNHFTWFFDIRDKKTGEDLYPILREKETSYDAQYQRLSRFMFHSFGLFPTSGDGHLGEYLPYAHEMMSTKGYDFEDTERCREDLKKYIDDIGCGTAPLDDRLKSSSGEKAFTIIKGITNNTNELILAVNLPNNGLISNLPFNAMVEVPALISGNGVNGIAMGMLPRGIAALCSAQINVQQLVIEAGYTGNRDMVIQALLSDPNVPSADAAMGIFNELMELNLPYLPQFHKQ